jgi:hypothetical protein
MEIPVPEIPVAYVPYVFMALLLIFVAGVIIALLDRGKRKEPGESKPS